MGTKIDTCTNLTAQFTQNPHKETPSKQVIASCRRDKNCCSCLRKLSIFIRRSSTQQHTTEYAICSNKKKCKFHYETVTNTKIAMKFRKNIKIKINTCVQHNQKSTKHVRMKRGEFNEIHVHIRNFQITSLWRPYIYTHTHNIYIYIVANKAGKSPSRPRPRYNLA